MTKTLILIAGLLVSHAVAAQTWSEWFAQNKTQKRYLLQQIAALRLYASHLQKGFAIAREGWGFIRDVKNGEFSLHRNYFGSLKAVNPAIAQFAQLAATLREQVTTATRLHQLLRHIRQSPHFSQAEIDLVAATVETLLQQIARSVTDLRNFLEPGKLELTDRERLERIETTALHMNDHLRAARELQQQVLLLVAQRASEQEELEQWREWNK